MSQVPENERFPSAPSSSRLGWTPFFDTAALPQRDRFSAWRDSDIRNLSQHFETRPTQPFQARIEGLDLGTMLLNHVHISAQDWHRGAAHLRDQADGLVVNVRHAGGAWGRMGDRDVRARMARWC